MAARKGRVQVKKKVARRRKERHPTSQTTEEAGSEGRIEPRQVQLSSTATGVPEDLIDELVRTQKSLSFARIIQFFAAFLFLALGATWLVLNLRSDAGGPSAEAATLSAGVFVLAVQLAACAIAFTILCAIGFRMGRFMKSIDSLESSQNETDLEFVVGYLRGIWVLIGGSFTAVLVIGGIFSFFLVK